jgi:hypothetical protein
VGYPIDRPGAVRRRALHQVAFKDRWNEPWPAAEALPDNGLESRWLSG